MPKIQAVLFDLDGTVADTAPDLAYAANSLRLADGVPPLPVEILRPLASQGARGLLKEAVGLTPDDAGFEHARLRFLSFYEHNLCVHTKLFPGIAQLLAGIEARKLPWGIVTNKPGFLSEPLLAALPELASCGVTVSADTLPVRKPDPAPMFFACERLGIAASQCLYVGDHVRDIEAGRNAGMRTAVAGWGYLNDDEDPALWGADLHFDTVQALHHWLRYELS